MVGSAHPTLAQPPGAGGGDFMVGRCAPYKAWAAAVMSRRQGRGGVTPPLQSKAGALSTKAFPSRSLGTRENSSQLSQGRGGVGRFRTALRFFREPGLAIPASNKFRFSRPDMDNFFRGNFKPAALDPRHYNAY